MIYERLSENFIVRDAEDFVPSLEKPTEKHYTLKVGFQNWTEVCIYVIYTKPLSVVKHEVFKRLICRGLGSGDCFVGFAAPDDNCLAQLLCSPSSTAVMCGKFRPNQEIITSGSVSSEADRE